MARNDVYRRTDGGGLVLDVQSDLLDRLNTRVVVPLLPKVDAPTPAARLNPVFEIEGAPYVMVTQFLAAVPAGLLGEQVASLDAAHDQITGALDLVFTGF